MQYIDAQTFLQLSGAYPILDVRSPAEFRQGHIPGAFNLPLFDDDERRKVGTLYHDSGREASVLLGLDIVGPKMSGFVKQVQKFSKGKEILVHCWRGGMRSSSMAWLLELSGFEVRLLQGGYKAYRAFIRQNAGEGYQLIVLGGKTGSGKTEILRSLETQGEQILDLEKIAGHKGSAFGHLGQETQPTNEQFENDLCFHLHHLNPGKPVWLEDESRSIGTVSLPDPFIRKMKKSPLIFIDVIKETRIKRLVSEYSEFEPGLLERSVRRISQRLGGQNTKLILEAIADRDFPTACDKLLDYYDKLYLAGISLRDPEKVFRMELSSGNQLENVREILKFYRHICPEAQPKTT
jgi:tRNA 2-selenouridine synthase